MKNLFKSSILTIILFLLCSTCVIAQDKYEYGSLFYNGVLSNKKYTLYVSLNDKYEELPGTLTEGMYAQNFTPLNKKATELSQQGWEVYNTSITQVASPTGGVGEIVYYFIRRKAK